MKKVKVSIVDNKTLKLEEDGSKGDIIDLNDVMGLDTTSILKAIETGRDQVYLEKINQALQEQKKLLKSKEELLILEAQTKLDKLSEELKIQKDKLTTQKALELSELKEKLNLDINELKMKNQVLSNQLAEQSKMIKLETENYFKDQINELKNKNDQLKEEIENQKTLLESNFQSKLIQEQLKLTKEFTLEKDKLKEEIAEHLSEVNKLRLSKDLLNVKMLGENLEKWCEQEFLSSTLNLLPNISFDKDTKEGNKADFIFRIYLIGAEKTESNELASVTLEMKSESTVAKTKTKNKDHFDKLEEDRIRNNTTYSLLVSELEWDVSNDTPIRKVTDYNNMYLVRPQYMIIFLNIVYAFAMQYHKELTKRNQELEKFKDRHQILAEFNDMKSQILDLSLTHIQNKLEDISKQTEIIEKANNAIKESLRIVLESHIKTVINKITNFEINKIIKKIELNEEK
ncbi:MAG: DUF2130 domain-containing protein [Acholeplasmataceae bacterium]|jgi:hypothetical protein